MMKRLKRWLTNWLLNDFRAEIEDVVARNERVRKLEIKAIEQVRDAIVNSQDHHLEMIGELQDQVGLLMSHDKQTFAEMEALRIKINKLKGQKSDSGWKAVTTKRLNNLWKFHNALAVQVNRTELPDFTTERMESVARLVEGFPNELNLINSQIRKMEQAPTSNRIATLLETMKRMGDELDCIKQDIQILQIKPEDGKNDERQERGSLVDRY